MKKVFLIHGFGGTPNGGWRPWLMGELAQNGVYACALTMPNPKNPVPAAWVDEIRRHVESSARDEIYLVGHSLGVPAILRFIESSKAKNIRGMVLVAGPAFKTNKSKVSHFLNQTFKFEYILKNVRHITIIHGEDDRSVSVEQGEFLAKELQARFIRIKKGGHLNGSSGWHTLPQCLHELERMFTAGV